jgi:hypothetical protein
MGFGELAERHRRVWMRIYPNPGAGDGRAVAVPLGVFAPGEAEHFLLDRTDRTDRQGAARLADDLGHLPLALDHAAAYCKRTGTSFDKYRELLPELIKRAPKDADYPRSVYATFSLAGPLRRCGHCRASLCSSAQVSGQAGIRSRFSGRAEILIGLCQLRVVPCPPRVPSPEAFGRRPVVHVEWVGIGRHPKAFTVTDSGPILEHRRSPFSSRLPRPEAWAQRLTIAMIIL